MSVAAFWIGRESCPIFARRRLKMRLFFPRRGFVYEIRKSMGETTMRWRFCVKVILNWFDLRGSFVRVISNGNRMIEVVAFRDLNELIDSFCDRSWDYLIDWMEYYFGFFNVRKFYSYDKKSNDICIRYVHNIKGISFYNTFEFDMNRIYRTVLMLKYT